MKKEEEQIIFDRLNDVGILFGSRSLGCPTKESDMDFLLPRESAKRLEEYLFKRGVEVDDGSRSGVLYDELFLGFKFSLPWICEYDINVVYRNTEEEYKAMEKSISDLIELNSMNDFFRGYLKRKINRCPMLESMIHWYDKNGVEILN